MDESAAEDKSLQPAVGADDEPAGDETLALRRPRSRDRLHGVTLAMMLESLVDRVGWDEMGRRIKIRCFTHEPSVSSSLKFLRRTPWAREKVERLYLRRCR